jgi:hypothetical protein
MHIRLYVAYLIAGGSVLVALAWVCSDDHLPALVGSVEAGGRMALGVALVSTLALGGGVYVLHLLWREAIVYAQVTRDDVRRMTIKGSHPLHSRRAHRSRRLVCSKTSANERETDSDLSPG